MADQVTERRTIILEIDGRKMQAGMDQANKSLEKTAGAVSKIKDSFETAKAAAAGFFIGESIRAFADYSDKATNLDNALKSLTTSTISMADAQDALFKIANDTQSSYEATTQVYTRMSRALASTGATSQQVLQVTKTLSEAFKISGVASEEASSAMLQLSQAFASGRLQGDEFRSVSENAPIVMDLLAKSLNVTTGELKALSTAGKLTSDVVFKALIEGGAQIDEQFKKVSTTFSGWATVMENIFVRVMQWSNAELATFIEHLKEVEARSDRMSASASDMGSAAAGAAGDVDKLRAKLSDINEALAAQLTMQKELSQGKLYDPLAQGPSPATLAKQISDLYKARDETQKLLDQALKTNPPQALTAAQEQIQQMRDEADYQKRFQEGQEKDREDIAKDGESAFDAIMGQRDENARKHAAEQKRISDKALHDQQAFNATLAELANKGNEYMKKAAEERDKREKEAFDMFDAMGKEVEAQDAATKKAADAQKALMDAATNTPWDSVISDVDALQKTLDNFKPEDFTLALAQGMSTARDAINETFSTLSQLSEGNFGLQKGLALAQAVINGALAITKVFAEVPPPASFGLAALIAGVTAAQVALITQQQPSASARATGGAVAAGRHYQVGENRPELYLDNSGRQILIPHASGRILPNAAMRGDVNVINNGPPLQVVRKTQRDDGGVDIVVAAVKATEDRFEQSMMTGQGKFASSIQRHTNVRRQL